MTANATWQHLRLADVCEITASPSSDAFHGLSSEVEDGTPVLSPPDITGEGHIDDGHVRQVPHVTASLERFRLAAGDIVVVRQGTLGRSTLITDRHRGWLYGSACMRVRPDRDLVEPAYLASYLAHPPVMAWLVARANPGTVATINTAVVARIPVPVPDRKQQQMIANALDEVDTQVSTQRALLSRLETLRPALLADFLGGHELVGQGYYGAIPDARSRVGRLRRVRRLS